MADDNKDRTARPEAYPKPSETDQQWKQQDEYSTQQPNKTGPQEISGVPTTDRNDLRAAGEDQAIEGTP